MGFSKNIKSQILSSSIENDCCCLSFLSGLFRGCGYFENNAIYFTTDQKELFVFVNNIFKQLYGEEVFEVAEKNFVIHKTQYYVFMVKSDKVFDMLSDFGVINEEGVCDVAYLDYNLFQGGCCKHSFIKGLFLGCGTSGIKINDTTRTTSGYDIEFASHSHELLINISHLLIEYDILPRIVKRGKRFVLYIKESSQVCDLLAILGAYNSVIELQDELSLRELRNKVNRETNCDSANIDRTIDASQKQLNAIKNVIEYIGLSGIPEDLQEVALLRLANPEESLKDLLKLSTTPMTKSGLYYKLQQLVKIAENI